MRLQKNLTILYTLISSAVMITLAVFLTATPVTSCAAPPQQGPLPTRDPTPTPWGYTGSQSKDDCTPVGASIVLAVQPAQANLWSEVEWQDSIGNWHTVEGWRGYLDNGNIKQWWVEAKDFNTGPFRWVVYNTVEGDVLGYSDSFLLPDTAGSYLTINISLTSGTTLTDGQTEEQTNP